MGLCYIRILNKIKVLFFFLAKLIWLNVMCFKIQLQLQFLIFDMHMYSRVKEKTKLLYLFQYQSPYRNETGTNHNGLLSTSIWCFRICLRNPSTWGSAPNFNFFNVKPQIWQRNRKFHCSDCLNTNFHNISDISLRAIRRRNYN